MRRAVRAGEAGVMVESILLSVSSVAWLALEITLIVRDARRGMGRTGRDRGTRSLNFILVLVAVVAADVLAGVAGPGSPLRVPGKSWIVLAGLIIIWAGLAIRVWAVAELGRSFRTTVEVDAGQAVVSSGPYRLVRHPSYTGLLLIATGFGLGEDTWPGLVICLVLPLAAMLWRIRVEEAELGRVLGEPYLAYREHTWRLVPGLW